MKIKGSIALVTGASSGIGKATAHLPPSTVHRLLSRAGPMHKEASEASSKDRRAFAHAGECWMSDVMHGPSIMVPGRGRRKTYLVAFIDDATRVVPYCAFAVAENTQAFLIVFKQALLRRRIPQRLYVDNGANYRSQQLALVCAKLGVALSMRVLTSPRAKARSKDGFAPCAPSC